MEKGSQNHKIVRKITSFTSYNKNDINY